MGCRARRLAREAHGKEGGVTNASSPVMDESITNVGAEIMGRDMFGGGPGPWPEDPPWKDGGAAIPRSTGRCSS